MNISPNEAEEALAAIQKVTQKTRHSISSSGAYIFLIITGAIWLVGFVATQFLPAPVVGIIWTVTSILGTVLGILLGMRRGRHVRAPSTATYVKRIGIFWLLLILFCIAIITVVQPLDGKQQTMIVILFIMIGQTAMGLLFSFSTSWWALPIAALALTGYFLLPGIFYLWMGILVGGGMIALGVYIRVRW
ncbi:MAG: hypothetical protein CVU39_00615 [Chloroflexi bacterium HGW-Chloroflexi-10]|nr:MAG: hypothetical protein CVU39_00615 [Chloroflexi bacterium HGW-Chloroflexi-10]